MHPFIFPKGKLYSNLTSVIFYILAFSFTLFDRMMSKAPSDYDAILQVACVNHIYHKNCYNSSDA